MYQVSVVEAVVDATTLVQMDVVVDLVAVLLVTMDPQSSLVVLEHQVKEMLVVKQVVLVTLVVAVAVVLVLLELMVMVIMVVTVVLDQPLQ